MQILHRLTDKRLLRDAAPGELGMAQIKAGVEHRYLDAVAVASAEWNSRKYQTRRRAECFRLHVELFYHSGCLTDAEVGRDHLRHAQHAPHVVGRVYPSRKH